MVLQNLTLSILIDIFTILLILIKHIQLWLEQNTKMY